MARTLKMWCSMVKPTSLPFQQASMWTSMMSPKNVASMRRLLRAALRLHFTKRGHTCWMENGGQKKLSARTAPRQRLHSTVSMLKCHLHLDILQWQNCSWCEGRCYRWGERNDWRKVAEWSWQVKCETWVWMVNGVSAWVALLMERDG